MTAQQIARQFAVDGFVRNLADGRVQLVAEGEMTEVASFLDAIQDRMEPFIRDVSYNQQMASGEFGGFAIRY